MKMLTKEITDKLPPLLTNVTDESPIIVKFFTPWSYWTWYAAVGEQIEGGDWEFFGMVHGHEKELGYFRLSELTEVRGPFGLKIERDMHFGFKHTLAEVR